MPNHFEDDADCVAVWKMEDGALGTDSKGSNNLTVNGGMASSADAKEGSYSGEFGDVAGAYMNIANASLDSGFPFKQGDSTLEFTICHWFKWETQNSNDGIYCMDDANKYCLRIRCDSDEDYEVHVGHNGGASLEEIKFDAGNSPIVQDIWYHAGVTLKDSDKSYRISIYDDNAGAQHASDTTGNYTNNINVEDSGLTIGSYSGAANKWDGHLDEMVVWKRVLSAAEIVKVRKGIFGCFEGTFNGTANAHTWNGVGGFNISKINGVSQAS